MTRTWKADRAVDAPERPVATADVQERNDATPEAAARRFAPGGTQLPVPRAIGLAASISVRW